MIEGAVCYEVNPGRVVAERPQFLRARYPELGTSQDHVDGRARTLPEERAVWPCVISRLGRPARGDGSDCRQSLPAADEPCSDDCASARHQQVLEHLTA